MKFNRPLTTDFLNAAEIEANTPITIGGGERYEIYHWDTFEPEGSNTILVGKAKTLEAAEQIVQEKYKDKINPNGADRVDIVDFQGNVVRQFQIC
jgi:hypothetical protein